jgi:chemotaxis protein methyltransferase CheR
MTLSQAQRERVLELVQRQFGIRGSNYAAARLDEAVGSVFSDPRHTSVDDLLASVNEKTTPRWLFEVVQYLTVGETYFLRDPAQITALRATVLPDMIARRTPERRLRLWSAGCSTGEEVYTLAILLREREIGDNWDIALVGTDVNRQSLRTAREGRYPAWSFRSTPVALRERFFEVHDDDWRLEEPLRRMARFAWLNLGAEVLMPPLTDADLIVCRNVTIYFDDVAAQRLYRALIATLAPGGWLMLGPSDPLPTDTGGLERLEVAETVLWRRIAAATPARRAPARRRPIEKARRVATAPSGELEAGLLALESGSAPSALEWLRRATFRQPDSVLAQFALARAYLAMGDRVRALAALVHTRRLLLSLDDDALLPGSDSVSVATLRQALTSLQEDLAR